MPYADKAKQRAYQVQWVRQRRITWFQGKTCVDCGGDQDLELDHVDPSTKVSSRIWGWSVERRESELSKCVVRCKTCHKSKTLRNRERARGEKHGNSKLTKETVELIRKRFSRGETQKSLAEAFGLSKRHVWQVVRGKIWV